MEGYHVITCEGKEEVITVPIPDDCKPLSCSIHSKGGATGLLASFYDPEVHTWVVKHAPVDVGHVTLTVKVLTLVDAGQLCEVYIAATSAEKGASVEELYALRRRSFTFRSAREVNSGDGGRGEARAWPPVGRERPRLPRDVVTLCAPLPLLGGYVLCGGGFVSDYPVYDVGPALPIATDRFYDCVMGEDAAFFAVVAAEAGDEGGHVGAEPFLVYDLLKPRGHPSTADASRVGAGGEDVEFSAWSVTAAPNAGLACFSIGLRSRDARKQTKIERELVLLDDTWLGGASLPARPARERPERCATANPPGGSGTWETAPATPHRSSSTQAAVFACSPSSGQRGYLMSPSRFSSPDSEPVSSPDSTLTAGSDGQQDRTYPSRKEDATGMLISGTTATAASTSVTTATMLPSSITVDGTSTALLHHTESTTAAGGRGHAVVFGSKPLFTDDEVMRELQSRKRLMRMVALRKLFSVRHRPQTHVMDVELPPPHGKVRARYGLCKETRAAAKLFYR